MNDMRMLMTIVRRDQGEEYLDFFRRQGIETVYAGLCRGTASKSMLDYLGIEKSEKCMLRSVIYAANAQRILRKLTGSMGINVPGNGVALTIPLGSVGGASCLEYLTKGQNTTDEEVKKMSEFSYALIVAIANKGNTDAVMDAAREAGARGGTVMNAKGTAAGFSSKFFGMSIAEEKEIVYIVAKKQDKAAIMKAIMKKAGMHSDAHTVLFSLPVDSIAGFGEMQEDDDEI